MNKIYLMFLCFYFVGCAPSHNAWKDSFDAFPGTKFSDHLDTCSKDCKGYLWSPANKKREFDKIVNEAYGIRYYVTWIRQCKYSLLISEDGVIKSWRYELELESGIKDCYIF